MLAKLFSRFATAPAPLAQVPEGRRIYAIGDIHGHLDLLDGLLAQIFADERTGGVSGELIFLGDLINRSEEHTSELQSLMRISYAVFCLKKKTECIRRRHPPGKVSTSHDNRSTNRRQR